MEGNSPGADARLRPTERVRRPAVFQGVLKGGRCFRDRVVRIHYRESGRELSRLGLVVSRRVGNAVIRNRIKRIFRELFRKAKARLDPPLDVVVVPDSRAGPQDRATYAKAFEAFVGALPPQPPRGGGDALPPRPPQGGDRLVPKGGRGAP